MLFKPIMVLLLSLMIAATARAQPAPTPQPPVRLDTPSGHPVPRFVALKSTPTNGRAGPSFEHPVVWRYRRRGLPMEIVAESENWRRVRDSDGDESWIHESMLDGRRRALIRSVPDRRAAALRSSPRADAGINAYAQVGAVVALLACDETWCRISAENHSGWVERTALWGLYTDERIE